MAEENKSQQEDQNKGFLKRTADTINSLSDTPPSKLGVNFNQNKHILKYPLDVETKNGHYMIFNIYARTDDETALPAIDPNTTQNAQYNADFLGQSERFFDARTSFEIMGETFNIGKQVNQIKDSIVLYMPDDISVNYKAEYEGAEVGLLVGAGVSIADTMKGDTGGFDAAKGVGLQFAKFIEPVLNLGTLTTGQGLNALLQRKTGLAPAAMQEMVFQGLPFRQFNYSFKMTPRNREEARETKRILDTFTFHMLPEKLGEGAPLAFRVPSEFSIRYMYRGGNNNYLNHMTMCALTDMKIDYGAGEKFQTFRADEDGAPPVQTNVTLTFQELELVDRRRFNNTHSTTRIPRR